MTAPVAPAPATALVAPAPATTTTFSLQLTTSSCETTDAQLQTSILARVPDAQRVQDGPADVAFVAETANRGMSALLVKLPEGESRREFHGASCDEAAAIIAFIAALVLDARPEERLHATELASLPEAPAPAAEAKPKAEPTTSTATRADSRVDVPPAPSGGKPRFGLNAAVALETAVAPTPPVGALVGAHLRWDRPGWLSPELRAELLVTRTATQAAKVGDAQLSLMAGRLSVCPLRFHSLKALQVGACATFDGGVLHAQGTTEIEGQPARMPWFAGGAALRTDVPLTQALELELLLSLKLLAYHDNFTLEPDSSVVYAVPLFSGGFALGLGFRP